MAISYNDANTGVFTHIGKIIKYINLLKTDATNLDSDLQAIEDIIAAGDKEDSIEGIIADFTALKSAHVTLRNALAGYVDLRMQDRTSVLNELNIASSAIGDIIPALIRQMNDDSETVDGSAVTIGSTTADGGNTGNGTVLTSKVLDGYSSPVSGAAAHIEYNGLDSELAVTSETMTVECIADSYTDGLTSGEEQFSLTGEIANNGTWDYLAEGSGAGPTITCMNASTLIGNRNFETWASNVPGSFTIDNGTAGTHIIQESGASNVYRGSSSLKIAGDGAQATIQISQAISPTTSGLNPLRRYCLSLRYKASATDTISQTFTVQFEGTGYTAASSEKIAITGDNWATSWTLSNFFVNLPANIPSDWELVIKVTGTMNTGKILYVDSLAFAPVDWHGGINAVVVAGSTPFVRGDRFTFTVANDGAGTFQEFARRQWKAQLPSDTGGSETIADSLAE